MKRFWFVVMRASLFGWVFLWIVRGWEMPAAILMVVYAFATGKLLGYARNEERIRRGGQTNEISTHQS